MRRFISRILSSQLSGSQGYWFWVMLLVSLSLVGLNAWARQLAQGLQMTGMGDEVSWGLYIANFTFLVGMAAAAVMMVIPAYIFKDRQMHRMVIFAELFAVAALVMCILFITVDIGRPDRAWHIIPGLGIFNWPSSLLTWDVVVLNVYLGLNLYVCAYVLLQRYRKKEPVGWLYLPIVFLAVLWAPSIHTVTAFLFQGLAARPLWNTALIAPRFIASAFAAGPAFMLSVFIFLDRMGAFELETVVEQRLRRIVTVCLLIHLFFIGSEFFTELYTGSGHSASFVYLFFGLHGSAGLVPWIWTSLILNLVAAFLLVTGIARTGGFLSMTCIFVVVGIWIEKGIGFVVPGFVPSPIGDLVPYVPSMNEVLICLGIWAFGLLLYTLMLKTAIPMITGNWQFSQKSAL